VYLCEAWTRPLLEGIFTRVKTQRIQTQEKVTVLVSGYGLSLGMLLGQLVTFYSVEGQGGYDLNSAYLANISNCSAATVNKTDVEFQNVFPAGIVLTGIGAFTG